MSAPTTPDGTLSSATVTDLPAQALAEPNASSEGQEEGQQALVMPGYHEQQQREGGVGVPSRRVGPTTASHLQQLANEAEASRHTVSYCAMGPYVHARRVEAIRRRLSALARLLPDLVDHPGREEAVWSNAVFIFRRAAEEDGSHEQDADM